MIHQGGLAGVFDYLPPLCPLYKRGYQVALFGPEHVRCYCEKEIYLRAEHQEDYLADPEDPRRIMDTFPFDPRKDELQSRLLTQFIQEKVAPFLPVPADPFEDMEIIAGYWFPPAPVHFSI